ncbi:MAG: cytochrome c [Gemmatimonadetes bacterium]|nr:cytochrome c [Gemmatimonadota bacterium]
MTMHTVHRTFLVIPLGLLAAIGGAPSARGASAVRLRPLTIYASNASGLRQDAPGQTLYLRHCKICHGATGKPANLMRKKFEKIPDLSDPAFFATRSEDSVVTVLTKGVGPDMKPFAERLSVEEMRAVATYIRSLSHAH